MNLIYVKIRIGIYELSALIDTGASLNIIDPTIAAQLNLTMKRSTVIVHGIGQKKTQGYIPNLYFRIGKLNTLSNFHVCSMSGIGVILGISFMLANKVNIFPSLKYISVKNTTIKLLSNHEEYTMPRPFWTKHFKKLNRTQVKQVLSGTPGRDIFLVRLFKDVGKHKRRFIEDLLLYI